MKPIRIGTRGSALALWQANWTRDALRAKGFESELVVITTTGDVRRDEAIVNLGAQGVFTKEIQKALLADEIDVAVHSLKDLPVEKIDGLTLAATPARGDHRDVFLSNKYASLGETPPGATIGTSSMRRKSMALNYFSRHFPNETPWNMANARGNVETRLKKLDDGEFDALILANAGLTRLGFDDRPRVFLEQPDFLPAVGQGALGLETRADDEETIKIVETLLDVPTYLGVLAERAFLSRLQGGCLVPIGAYGTLQTLDDGAEILVLQTQILSFDGLQAFGGPSIQIMKPTGEAPDLPWETRKALAELLGRGAAENLLEQGAAELVDAIRRVRETRATENSRRE